MIRIEGTDLSPTVVLDPERGTFEISGISVPENSSEIFSPVLQHIRKYKDKPQVSTTLTVKMEYFNTSTSKYILDILTEFQEMRNNKASEVTIYWYYKEEDEDMKEIGQDFRDLLRIPIQFEVY